MVVVAAAAAAAEVVVKLYFESNLRVALKALVSARYKILRLKEIITVFMR